MTRHGAGVLALLAPRPGERVLDLGCGTGHLTDAIAESGAEAFGLDANAAMIHVARETYPHLRFEVADAHDMRLDQPVDAVFSNAALHWMTRPSEVVRSVAAVLRPGGRFAAEMGGSGNIAHILGPLRAALEAEGIPRAEQLAPWYFPAPDEYLALLAAHGLEVRYMRLFSRMTPLEGGDAGLRDWLRIFAPMFLDAVPAARWDAVFERVEDASRSVLYRDGRWHADYRRLRFLAVRRAG